MYGWQRERVRGWGWWWCGGGAGGAQGEQKRWGREKSRWRRVKGVWQNRPWEEREKLGWGPPAGA